MIPTQCPLGKDTRMCEYCDHKDTCTNRCNSTSDVIWGEISGDLTNQTDLAKEFASVRSEITNANSFSSVRLNIIDANLYVVAPIGLLNADTDKPVFARYVKSSIRKKKEDGGYEHYKRRGWIRPVLAGGFQKKYPCVPMIMEKVTRWDSDVYDYFLVKSGASDFRNQSLTYTDKIANDLYTARQNLVYDCITLEFALRKLGLCIERNGVQITNYLPFAVRNTEFKKNGEYENGYVLSRWDAIGFREGK